MNILILTKRRYMSRDLIDERYGRLYYLPEELAARGHTIEVLCLDYHWTISTKETSKQHGVVWHSTPALPFGGLRYKTNALKLGKRMKADLVVGMSDPLYGIWARAVADKLNCPYAFDLYDNFETWASMRFPFVPSGYARALNEANVVSCVSDRLSEYVKRTYTPAGPTITVQSVVDQNIFKPLDKATCRKTLNLPASVPLIGYFGAIDQNRGINELFEGWKIIHSKVPEAWLILAGKLGKGISLPGENEHVRYMGLLPHSQMPAAINASNVVTVFNVDSPFGRYCFPQKLCEYMACGVPVMATDLGAVSDFLRPWEQCRFPAGHADIFAEKVLAFLKQPMIDYGQVPTWSDVVTPWEEALRTAIEKT